MSEQKADLVLSGGTVISGAATQASTAIAIKGSRILALGADADVIQLVGPKTQVLQLDGRTVLPGLIDAHAHMEREGLKRQRRSLAGLRSIDEVLSAIRSEAAQLPHGAWIVTMPIGDPPYYFGGPAALHEKR